MTDERYLSLRRKIEKHAFISDEEWENIRPEWELINLKKGDFIISPGLIEQYFYFVDTGMIRASILHEGVEVSVGFSYDGDYSGAFDSMLAQQPTDLTLEALSDCKLLKINHKVLNTLFDQYKSMERWGRLLNAELLIGMARRQVEVRTFTAEERYNRLLKQSPHIFQLVSQKHLASYLGMTPETFSRLRKIKSDLN